MDHSDKSAVTSTQIWFTAAAHKPNFISMLIFFFIPNSLFCIALSFFTQPPSILLTTLLLSHLANLIPVSFSLVISSALLPLSRPSWGAQCDGDGRVAVRCVCLCDVTLQWLYSCTLFFFPSLIPALMDHTAILRFYKPFQRASRGKLVCALCTVCV